MEWAQQNGFRAVILDKVFPVQEHCYSDPYGSHRELWPFFKRAEELGMPLFLHNIQHGHRITNLMNYQFNGLDVLAPQEGQMSLVSLITSGLLDDFPKLNFVFTEAGVAFIKPLVAHLNAWFDNSVVDYESEDAAPRFNYRKLAGGKRIVSAEDYKSKNKQSPDYYFKKNPRRVAIPVCYGLSARRSGRAHEVQGRRAARQQPRGQRGGQGSAALQECRAPAGHGTGAHGTARSRGKSGHRMKPREKP